MEKIETKPLSSKIDTGLMYLIHKTLSMAGFASIFMITFSYLATFGVKLFLDQNIESPWQYLWDKVVDTIGDDFFYIHVFGSIIVTNSIFFGVGAFFMFMDLTGRPQFLRKYKIQPGTNEPLKWDRFKQLLKQIISNTLIFGNLFNILTFYLHTLRGSGGSVRTLPSLNNVLFELSIFAIVEEIFFFYSHWAFHKSRFLYSNIHKRHHEWQSTVAYAAIYAHPVEHFFSNMLPSGLGPILCGSHVTTMWLWYAIVVSVTLNSHSGYHLPFMPSPEAHDYHHLKFNQCFGVLGFLDFIHGTDAQFRQSKAFQRDITLTSLKSAREIIPENQDQTKSKNK